MAAQDDREVLARIADWSRLFQAGEMSVEDVHEEFATLGSEQLNGLAPEVSRALSQAMKELDAIHFGMCESGQTGEIIRIFRELSFLPRDAKTPR